MNKKGFTLTELLAVIVILSVVMLIGSTSIGAVQNKINKEMFGNKLGFVISAAKSYGQDNKHEIPDSGKLIKTVGQLIESDYLQTDESVNKSDYSDCEDLNIIGSKCTVVTNNFNDKIINAVKVEIYLSNGRVYACINKDDNDESLFDSYADYDYLNYYC